MPPSLQEPLHLGRRRLRRAERRRRPGPLLSPRRARPTPSTRPRSRSSTATTCRRRRQTWQQLLDIAALLQRQELGQQRRRAGQRHRPASEGRRAGPLSLPVAVGLVRRSIPGDKVDRTQNVYWFDPVDMKPLINSPGHVKALEFLQELHKTGPAAQVGWSLGEAWDYFLRGKAVFVLLLGRRRRALPGRDAARRSRARSRCGDAAGVRHLLGHGEEGVRQADKPRRSATPPAARGTASSRTSRPTRRRPTRSCR